MIFRFHGFTDRWSNKRDTGGDVGNTTQCLFYLEVVSNFVERRVLQTNQLKLFWKIGKFDTWHNADHNTRD